MTTTNRIAVRVARRHHAREGAVVVPTTIRLNAGSIFAIEAKLALEPLTGYLRKFRLRRVDGTPTIVWEGLAENGELVTANVLLHATVTGNEVQTWAEVMVDTRR